MFNRLFFTGSLVCLLASQAFADLAPVDDEPSTTSDEKDGRDQARTGSLRKKDVAPPKDDDDDGCSVASFHHQNSTPFAVGGILLGLFMGTSLLSRRKQDSVR